MSLGERCIWCEQPLPKRPFSDGICSRQCAEDKEKNAWPAWMTGRIGLPPSTDWHMSGEFLCLSAPNRYRTIFRSREPYDISQGRIKEMQCKEFPWLANPAGLDIDYPTWDQVLIWRGPTVADARRGA